MDDLKEALAFLDTLPPILGDGPHTAELLNEEAPEGPVILSDKEGRTTALLPRDVWDSLQNWGIV